MSLKLGIVAMWLAAAGTAASILVAPLAGADPVWPVAGAESASDTIADLQAQGYDVQINWVTGYSRAPLSRCSVSGINNPDRSPGSDKTLTTVYVDVVCPNDDWDWGGVGIGVGIG
ncbi:MAG: hypothetical protein JO044_04710 [Mycobacteriaceae bacterium]|nr:hypothetical protein [Mycobacteriaceae bacterium]